MTTTPLPQQTFFNIAFDHVALSVGDLEAMRDWYITAFDLTVDGVFELPERASRGLLLLSPSGFRIELIEKTASIPATLLTPGEAMLQQGINHFCLRTTDLQSTVNRLTALGAEIVIPPTASAFPDESMSYIADIEGNLIELMGPTIVDHTDTRHT